MCPANWQPGDKTIIPSQTEKLSYFESAYQQKQEDPNAFNVKVTKPGDGVAIPNGAKISVHYTGTLLDGTVFDSSVTRGQPFTFNLGQGRVIKCWDEGFG